MSEHEHHAPYLAARPYSREEVLAKPYPVPAEPGVYGWWFRSLPADIDTSKCVHRDGGLVLLYAGISPSKPSATGVASKQNIRRRIGTRYTDLPLNIDGADNTFTATLRAARRSAIVTARELPVVWPKKA